MSIDAIVVHSMLNIAVELKAAQERKLDAAGNYPVRSERSVNVDELLAQQLGEALANVDAGDVEFLVQFLESVIDFPKAFAVVQAALDRAQHLRMKRDAEEAEEAEEEKRARSSFHP